MGRGATADRAAGQEGAPAGRSAVRRSPATFALPALALGALACQSRDIASDPPTHTHVFITQIASVGLEVPVPHPAATFFVAGPTVR